MFKPNVVKIRIQPDEGMSLHFMAKVPGEHLVVEDVAMSMSYAGAFRTPLSDAYERLLLDSMRGDATLFARRDAVEESWRFITPVLDAWAAGQTPLASYEPGSSGPSEAEALIARDGRSWQTLKSA